MGLLGFKAKDMPGVLRTVVITAGAGVAVSAVVLRAISAQQHHVPELLESPPVAERIAHTTTFGAVDDGANRGENPMTNTVDIEDDLFWLRDDSRKNKNVLAHLKRENAYAKFKTKHLENLRKALYDEQLSHVQETDVSVPYKDGEFWYYSRTVEGLSYAINARVSASSLPKDTSDDPLAVPFTLEDGAAPEGEQIVLDENKLAKGLPHCNVAAVKPSPDHGMVAYSMDSSGYETYAVRFVEMSSGKTLEEEIPKTTGSIVWGKTKKEIFYATQDDAHRPHKVWRHVLGTDPGGDECIYSDDDEMFSVGFYKSKDGSALIVGSQSSDTSEWHLLALRDGDENIERPPPTLTVVEPRKDGVEYDVETWHGDVYVITNKDDARNFKLVSAPVATPSSENWKEVLPYDEAVKLDGFSPFRDFAVVSGRKDGFTQLWLMRRDGDERVLDVLSFEEDAHAVYLGVNKEFESDVVRFSYSSMTTPRQTWAWEVSSGRRLLLKETPVPNYDRTKYASRRAFATAVDGTRVPISIVSRNDVEPTTPAPTYLYGYGSYEISLDPSFSASYLPLLDRGVKVAVAHVRGGGELGRTWYDPGARYLTKINTFTDFISCAEALVAMKEADAARIAIEGRSAGGLLVGAVLNMRPELFCAAVAGVPFVDVMQTMSDATIPLTTGEWKEWGNPHDERYFEYIRSYSPVDNVAPNAYPNILVTAGLWDPRVAYWEPAKWVQRIRERQTNGSADGGGDGAQVLLKTDLDSGHFSASDRYKYIKERAYDLAFLLDQLGVADRQPHQ